VAVVAALYAKRQVDDNRLARREQVQPYVVVDIEPSPASRQILEFVTRNTGATIAREVMIESSPPLPSIADYSLTDSVLMTDGLPMLAPNQELRFFFAPAEDLVKAGGPLRYDITVTFKDLHGTPHTMNYTIDLAVLTSQWYVTVLGIHDLAKSTKSLAGDVRKLVGEVHDLNKTAKAVPGNGASPSGPATSPTTS
jgi:hypothetical protein